MEIENFSNVYIYIFDKKFHVKGNY